MSDVLLSSGGLDSAVIAGFHHPSHHLYVFYGQRNFAAERLASQRIARHYLAQWDQIPFREFGQLANSSITRGAGVLIGAATVVPGRNTMLISLAASLAESTGGGVVYIGCNANDYETYPDCRPAFIDAMNEVLHHSTGGAVTLWAPLVELTKQEIGQLARDHEVPVEMTWSCYTSDPNPCGTCGACTQRAEALHVHDH